MNEILETLKEDRFAIHCPRSGNATGPWTLRQVAEVLATIRVWDGCEDEHTIELIEVTN